MAWLTLRALRLDVSNELCDILLLASACERAFKARCMSDGAGLYGSLYEICIMRWYNYRSSILGTQVQFS